MHGSATESYYSHNFSSGTFIRVLGAAAICPEDPVPSVGDFADQIIEVLNFFGYDYSEIFSVICCLFFGKQRSQFQYLRCMQREVLVVVVNKTCYRVLCIKVIRS